MIKKLEIKSPKIKTEKRLLLISDIHKSKNHKKDNLSKLKEDLKQEFKYIDYIIISGDIIDSPNHLIHKDFIEELKKYLEDFIEDKKTYIVLGNHDIDGTNIEEEYLYSILRNINNLKCLNNKDKIDIGDISIEGFTPNIDYFKTHQGRKYEFKKKFNEVKRDKLNSKKYNILITHDSTSIIELSNENKEFLDKDIDLIVSGHMHNGLVPNKFQNIMNHKGFVGPYKKLFPNYAHGVIKINNTNIIILGAINPIISIPITNKLYGYDATILTLKKVK